MKYKMIILSVFILIVLTIGAVSASDNETIGDENIISQEIDEDIELEEEADGGDELNEDNLQNAITPSGNTFDDIQQAIDNAKENDTILLDGEYVSNGKTINIDKSLTIQGLSNRTTLNANFSSEILSVNSDCKFINLKKLNFINSQQGYQAAVSLVGTGYIENCTFSNNLGGAIYSDENCEIINSQFINNGFDYTDTTWGSRYGAAISFRCNCTVRNSEFRNNSANYGGAIAYYYIGIIPENESLLIYDSEFIDNVAEYGSAIYSYANTSCINSNFKNNDACSIYIPADIKIINCNLTGSKNYGIINSKDCFILNSNFKNSNSDFGGAVECINCHVENSSFVNNAANFDGGAIKCSNLTALNCIFSSNHAGNNGGAIYVIDSQTDLYNCTFNDNYVKNSDGSFTYGGALCSESDNGVIDNCNFLNNYVVEGHGPGTYLKGNFLILSSLFDSNYNYDVSEGNIKYVSAIYAENLIVLNSIFRDSKKIGVYSAFLISANQCILVNCNGSNCRFDVNNFTIDDCNFDGGVEIDAYNANISNSKFSNLKGDYLVMTRENLHVDNCEFNKFACTLFYNYDNSRSTLSNCNFIEGKSYVVYTSNSLNNIINCNFSKNKEICIYADNADVDSCNFLSNSAECIWVQKSLNLFNSKFSNHVKDEEIIFVKGNYNLINNTFKNNNIDLAVIKIWEGKGVIENCIFENANTPAFGSIFIESTSSSVIKNNVAKKYSGTYIIDNSFNVYPIFNVKVNKLKAGYSSNKYFTLKFSWGYKDSVIKKYMEKYWGGQSLWKWYRIKLTLSDGKKTKVVNVKINDQGKAAFKISKLAIGKYKVKITENDNGYDSIAGVTVPLLKYSSIEITKAKAKVKAPKITAKFKKSKFFKVTVKYNKKAVKKVKVKLKVYTGKKFKTYTLKTNKKGVAKLNAKKLKKGKYKVVISSGNKNYKFSAKSKIVIK